MAPVSFLIKSRLLIDGTGAPAIREGAVVVEGRVITAVGPLGEIVPPPNAITVDCGYDTVLPGFVDSHTHVTLNSCRGLPLKTQADADPAMLVLHAASNLRRDLAAGVTCMRALGETVPFVDLSIRDAVSQREIPGPRLLVAGRALRPSHGTGSLVAQSCDGPDALRKAVRENIAAGVDVIKVIATNLTYGETASAQWRGDLIPVRAYTRDEIAAVVEEAHNAGLKVAAHALGGPAMRWALECGVDSIEHANLIEEEDVELFLEVGAWISTPNLQLFFDSAEGLEGRPDYKRLPLWCKERIRRAREQTRQMLPQVLKAGVKIALGADTRHGQLWREAVNLVKLGCDPMDVIVAITRRGAELCGIEDEVGTLEVGKLANVVSVKGDPTRDMAVLKDVGMVMIEGELYQAPPEAGTRPAGRLPVRSGA